MAMIHRKDLAKMGYKIYMKVMSKKAFLLFFLGYLFEWCIEIWIIIIIFFVIMDIEI